MPSKSPVPYWPISTRIALKVAVSLNLIVTLAGFMMMARWNWEAFDAVALPLWAVVAIPGVLWLRADIITTKGDRCFRWCLAGVILSAVVAVSMMVVMSDVWALVSLILPAWMTAPIAIAVWLGPRLIASRGQWLFVIGLMLTDLGRLWAYRDIFHPESFQSLAGLILMFLPVYQFPAYATLLGFSWFIGRASRTSHPA